MLSKIIPLALLTISIASCEVTVGDIKETNKDMTNEVKNGFSYKKIEKTINGIEPVVNNELTAGENFIMLFTDVNNATVKDGFQHVGISIKITNSAGEVLIDSPDLLSNVEQQDAKLNRFTASYGVPSSEIDKDIIIEYQLFDKYGSGKYDFKETYHVVKRKGPVTTGVEIKTNLEGLDIYTQIIEGKTQYESSPVALFEDTELYFYLCGLKNLTLKDNFLDMTYEMTVLDQNGVSVFSQEDVLQGDVSGFDTYPIFFTNNFKGFEKGKYTWKIYCKDKNSDKFVEISTIVNII